MMMNTGIDKVSQVMIDILKSRPEITKPFMASMCNDKAAEVLWEVLLDCTDKSAQKNLARVLKYALCQLKIEEKESALAKEMVNIPRMVTIREGEDHELNESFPKAICIRFIWKMAELLEVRAPKNWRKFDNFLEIFHDVMVFSAEEVDLELMQIDKESEAYKVGVELYF